MKKYLLLLLLVLSASFFGSAQEYSIKRNTGRLKLRMAPVTVIGYDGNEIIIKKNDNSKENKADIRANGLKRLGVSGYEPILGLGVSVAEKDGIVEIEQFESKTETNIVIMVPKSMSVSVINGSSIYGGVIKFTNMQGEIEIDANFSPVELENISGPLTVSTISEPIKVSFGNTIRGPVSINSVSGHIEVTITGKPPLDLNLSTVSGQIFLEDSVQSDFVKSNTTDDNYVRGSVKGKYKGGGEQLRIRTVSSHISIKKNN